jgi:hypothetical protein
MRPSLLPSLRSSLSPRPLLFDHVFALACKHLRTHSLTDAPAGMAGGLELLECGLKAFETALFKTKLSLLSLRMLSLRALGLSSFCSVERCGGGVGGGVQAWHMCTQRQAWHTCSTDVAQRYKL